MASGTVIDLWRWPVLGMQGERLGATRIDVLGVAGDRVHSVDRVGGPELGRWSAAYPFAPDGAIDAANLPYPTIRSPHGGERFRWGDPRLADALERDLGRAVEPVRDVHAQRGVIVATVPPPEPRLAGINLQLELEPPASGWSGAVLSFQNGVRLRLFNSRGDGPGIEAIVLAAGRVELGESVALG